MCVIERFGNLAENLASTVQLPRNLMEGSPARPVITGDPGPLPGRIVMEGGNRLEARC